MAFPMLEPEIKILVSKLRGFKTFAIFLRVLVSVSENLVLEKSLGFGFGKFGFRKSLGFGKFGLNFGFWFQKRKNQNEKKETRPSKQCKSILYPKMESRKRKRKRERFPRDLKSHRSQNWCKKQMLTVGETNFSYDSLCDLVGHLSMGQNMLHCCLVFQKPHSEHTTEKEFVTAVTAGGSVKFLSSGVNFSIFTHFLCFYH